MYKCSIYIHILSYTYLYQYPYRYIYIHCIVYIYIHLIVVYTLYVYLYWLYVCTYVSCLGNINRGTFIYTPNLNDLCHTSCWKIILFTYTAVKVVGATQEKAELLGLWCSPRLMGVVPCTFQVVYVKVDLSLQPEWTPRILDVSNGGTRWSTLCRIFGKRTWLRQAPSISWVFFLGWEVSTSTSNQLMKSPLYAKWWIW